MDTDGLKLLLNMLGLVMYWAHGHGAGEIAGPFIIAMYEAVKLKGMHWESQNYKIAPISFFFTGRIIH